MLTSKCGWKLSLLLLLTWTFHTDGKGKEQPFVVKTGSKSALIPICTNDTLPSFITFIKCTIRTERMWEGECQLLYRHRNGNMHNCDRRFTFMFENQTVFLRLAGLKKEDSGNYTCLCSRYGELNERFSQNVTMEDYYSVQEDEDASSSTEKPVETSVIVGISVCVVLISIGVILGVSHRKCQHRQRQDHLTYHPNVGSQNSEQYLTFIEKANELYSTNELLHTN